MIPPTTPHVAMAYASSSETLPRIRRTGRATPKKMPIAVKIPCHEIAMGPRWRLGSNGISIICRTPYRRVAARSRARARAARLLASVTLLVLLPRAAEAGIVAAELLAVRRLRRARGSRLRAVGGRLRRRGRRLFLCRGLLGGLHAHAHDRLRDARADARLHLLVEAVRLVLVCDERVLLPVAAQVDALAELFHGGQVLDPMRVDRAQEHPALDRVHDLWAELGLALLVRLVDELGGAREEVITAIEALEGLRRDLPAARQDAVQRGGERREVPLLRVRHRVGDPFGKDGDLGVQVVEDRLAHVALLEDRAAVLVDPVALVVQDVVELERALADVEVPRLDLDLGLGDRAGHHPRLDRLAVVEAEARHESRDTLRGEDAHEVVLERVEEPRGAGIPLAAGAAPELVVDPARLVALGPDDVQPARIRDALPEEDVDASSGHVRREGNGALLTCVGDDERLALVVLRVEDLVLDAVPFQLAGEPFALLDRCRPDEDRLAFRVPLSHLGDDGVPLALLGLVDEIRMIDADHRPVRRDLRDLELVDLEQLLGLGRRRTGHAGELLVHAEVVL